MKGAKRPAVACSFGKDSLLILALAREVWRSIEIIWLHHHLTAGQRQFAEQIIKDWSLGVLNFGVTGKQAYRLQDASLTMGYDYTLNGEKVTAIHDVVHSDNRCILDLQPMSGTPLTLPFDKLLIGTKASDSHELMQNAPKIGEMEVVAPLWGYTDAKVYQFLRELNVPIPPKDERLDPSNIIACCNCLIDESLPCWKYNARPT